MMGFAPKPTIGERLYYFFHREFTLVEAPSSEGKTRVTVIQKRRREAVKLAKQTDAPHWMLYRKTDSYGWGKLIMERHNFPYAENERKI